MRVWHKKYKGKKTWKIDGFGDLTYASLTLIGNVDCIIHVQAMRLLLCNVFVCSAVFCFSDVTVSY